MRHRLFYHVVWTTHFRKPLIDKETAQFLCATLRTLAREQTIAGWAGDERAYGDTR